MCTYISNILERKTKCCKENICTFLAMSIMLVVIIIVIVKKLIDTKYDKEKMKMMMVVINTKKNNYDNDDDNDEGDGCNEGHIDNDSKDTQEQL